MMKRWHVVAFIATLFLFCLAGTTRAQLYGSMANVTPANPTGTASLTGVALGLGADTAGSGANKCQMYVQKTGRVWITFNFESVNSTAGDGARVKLVYGTGTAPANGTAVASLPAGSTQVGIFQGDANGGTIGEAQSVTYLLSGLSFLPTVTGAGGALNAPSQGVLYWFDLIGEAVTGGTATWSNVTCSAAEVAN